MTKKINNTDDSDDKMIITDRSNDHQYFAQIPRLIQAVCRSPYDFTLWCIIKDIAGEKSKCTLNTSQLAILAMMSEGQVADSRKYLLEQGLLEGEKVLSNQGNLSLWHLWIPDVWSWNIRWAETHRSISSRIQWKIDQKGYKDEPKFERVCRRCKQSYMTNGRRSKRCEGCQSDATFESESINNQIRQPQKKYIENIPTDNRFCVFCEGMDDLELHLDSETLKLTVVCATCHDNYHYKVLGIHDMNAETSEVMDSSHETLVDQHESLGVEHESISILRESKNNSLKESLNNNKKRDSNEVWDKTWMRVKSMVGTVGDLWNNKTYVTLWDKDTLVVVVNDSDWYDWLVERKAFISNMVPVEERCLLEFKLSQ